MKLLIFAFGAAAGFAFGRYQHEIVRSAVRGGMAAGTKLRELQEEIAEDIEDHIAEVRAERQEREAH